MFEINEFDNLFQRMSRPFLGIEDIWDELRDSPNITHGPYYYGYSVTMGQDGKPIVKEYGNVRPRDPFVDTMVDDKEKILKIVAEMPGIEKKDIQIEVVGRTITIDAERGERKYHTKIPLKQRVDENSVKATYENGILEMKFNLKEEVRTKGKTVTVE